MRDLTLRHKIKKSDGAFNVLLHFTVTEWYLTIKHSSYPNRYVKHPISCNKSGILNSLDWGYLLTHVSFWCHLVYNIFFLDANLSTREQSPGEVILQLPSALYVHLAFCNNDKLCICLDSSWLKGKLVFLHPGYPLEVLFTLHYFCHVYFEIIVICGRCALKHI
jgi:hypothetical protein